jgi:predicted O-methyltransferase YrrM
VNNMRSKSDRDIPVSAILAEVMARFADRSFRGAEIGVLRGDTSAALLQQFPQLVLLMVDTWSSVPTNSSYARSHDSAARQHWAQHTANEQIAYTRTEFAADRRVLVRGKSTSAALVIADSSLDFAFIDADHTYDAVVADIASWWPKIRNGGILAGHDYGGRKNRCGLWGVSKAVDEFVAHHRLTLHTGAKSIWWVQRSAEDAIVMAQIAPGEKTVQVAIN